MENIESSISELGVIFRQLATLVSEQGEMITRIDSNVESTSINIETAHHELLKYFNNISKNRWLIIKVFGVLMAFFVFFRHIYGIKQEHITFLHFLATIVNSLLYKHNIYCGSFDDAGSIFKPTCFIYYA